jgi:hypothetical protein
VGVESLKLSPTWRNLRTREEKIEKRLDRFLVSELVMNDLKRIRTGVEVGGHIDHLPILSQIDKEEGKPSNPFKCNAQWLKYEGFLNHVKMNG